LVGLECERQRRGIHGWVPGRVVKIGLVSSASKSLDANPEIRQHENIKTTFDIPQLLYKRVELRAVKPESGLKETPGCVELDLVFSKKSSHQRCLID